MSDEVSLVKPKNLQHDNEQIEMVTICDRVDTNHFLRRVAVPYEDCVIACAG